MASKEAFLRSLANTMGTRELTNLERKRERQMAERANRPMDNRASLDRESRKGGLKGDGKRDC